MAETETETGGETGDVEQVAPSSLPRWRSHKEVGADKIKGIVRFEPRDPDEAGVHWNLEHGGIINVTPDLIARGEPMVGDYFIEYADGYRSWSPASAFEEGYISI